MSQILLLQSSLNGPASRTNQLMERFLQTRREQGHQDQVVVRDLTALDLPALDSPLFHALRGRNLPMRPSSRRWRCRIG